ncbi:MULTISPECIES: 4Fe-4S binding protein [Caldisericum]|jgi:2-oxoglutarate ferredoxin oxidoreductase subunit delta|uniref:4Fe-4S binding protein n=1 Tax=Caldisericum TaxID=693074 RepID=UPI003C71DF35
MAKNRVIINKDFCKGCGICVSVCPAKILRIGEDFKVEVVNEERCMGCGMCEVFCPDFAILIKKEVKA